MKLNLPHYSYDSSESRAPGPNAKVMSSLHLIRFSTYLSRVKNLMRKFSTIFVFRVRARSMLDCDLTTVRTLYTIDDVES